MFYSRPGPLNLQDLGPAAPLERLATSSSSFFFFETELPKSHF
jgi:hypothetical protein